MPRVELEPIIPVFEQCKTTCALNPTTAAYIKLRIIMTREVIFL